MDSPRSIPFSSGNTTVQSLVHFRSLELAPLFKEERERWRQLLQWDFSKSLELFAAMIDTQRMLGYVALEGTRPVGHVLLAKNHGNGLIVDYFVTKRVAGCGVEEQLLHEAITHLKSDPSISQIQAQLIGLHPWDSQLFFVGEGVQTYKRLFMMRDCSSLPQRASSCGEVRITPWQPSDLEEATQLTYLAYLREVDRQITSHYRSLEGCRFFLDSLMLQAGCGVYLQEGSYSARQPVTGHLVGFILTSTLSPGNGHIPQIVVSNQHQGKGLGTLLLAQALSALATLGFAGVSLTVTEANGKALSLYRSLGFSPRLAFPACVWTR